MADMLTIGTLAANTFKKALDVTSHNVANINTEGYSRQRAEIVNNTPSIVGNGFLGGGARVDSVERIHAEYLQKQLLNSNSLVERYDSQLQLSKQVEGVVASNDEGVQEFMQRFFDALQNLSDNPTSNTSRQLLINEASSLESHVGNLSSVLEDTQYQVNNQVKDLAIEINNRLEIIQQINVQVSRAMNNNQQPPNDLLDRRDQAVLELSQYMDIEVFPQDDGRLDIHSGNGRLPLLSDNTLTKLETGLSPYTDENRTEVYMTLGGVRQVISDRIGGGELGGVLNFRDNMLGQAQNDLGLTLNGMVASINWQHYQGYDINGDAGGNFFNPLSMNAMDNINNNGSVSGTTIAVSFNPNAGVSEPPYIPATQPATYGDKKTYLQNALTEIGRFEAREYEIRYEAATDSFAFIDYTTQKPVLDSGGTAITVARGAVANVEGFSFDFSGVAVAPADGDSYLVKPHKQILEDFATSIKDGDLIAARGQSPVDSDSDGTLDDEVPAAAAVGDNVNMANLAGLQSAKILLADANDQASETLLGGYSKMATNVGMYVRGTDIQLQAQTNVYEQLTMQRESISGVSLDEEAANLMRFQQAYEAAAQIISTSQTIFQTLIGAIRG